MPLSRLFFTTLFYFICVCCLGQQSALDEYHHTADSVGPVLLPFDLVDTTFFLIDGDNEALKFRYGYTLNQQNDNTSFLLYKKDPRDTTYVCLRFPFSSLIVDTLDLDHAGKFELMISAQDCSAGAKGASCTGAILVLNIDQDPVLLLKIYNYHSEETFSSAGYSNDDVNGPENFRYSRSINHEGDKIIVSPNNLTELRTIEKQFGPVSFPLTKFPSGTFIFQEHWVLKKVSSRKRKTG